jgi:hypothetical protein
MLSQVLMILSSTERQYWGDFFSRQQALIQTHSHGTFLWILRPVSATQASQFTQTFLQVSLTLQSFLSWWGGRSCAPGDPHSCFQCRSSFAVRWRHQVVIGRRGTLTSSGCLYIQVFGLTLMADGAVSSRWGGEPGFWVPAWVYIPGGDLTTPVIVTATLGLVCLPITIALGLAY